MSVNISIEVEKKLKAIDKEMKRRVVKADEKLREAAVNKVMRGKRGGAKYGKPGMSTKYTSSAPGEPPAVRTGTLRNSFRPTSKGTGGAFLSVTAGIETDTGYAGYLEHGTRKMAARPYVEKIKQEALPDIQDIYAQPYNV